MAEAAIFDLDRTLLRGASGPMFGEALRAAGVLSQRRLPGEGLVYKVFDTVGETLPAMFLARRAAGFANGWSRQAVIDAARNAAEALGELLQPFAGPILDDHKRAGRILVLATTTPYDMVEPFAAALGFDDLVATRYGVKDGKYDGTIDGHFVWGPGKLAAVREWAAEHGVDLERSWAYSDSVFDVPLLSAVGSPVAVNPDARLRLVALARRWPVRHLDLPPGVPKLAGIEPFRIMAPLLRPELFPYARFDIEGVDHIPLVGPAIVVANHRSYFDPVAVGLTIAQTGRPIRFLGKKEVFAAPVIGPMARALGGIAVDRGTGSDEPLQAAADALRGGQLVAMMPQGTIPRGREFFEPELKGRWGVAKLAAMTHAPVIPLGLWGTEQVWPRSSRLPNLLNLTHPPDIQVRVGTPVDLKYRSANADTERIMAAVADLLPPEARERREPTAEELRRAMPPGSDDDPDAQVGRRPGAD
jgi:putative phosphoserine phosphatase/1-acylglycerol-3-phosphate O-acyltransferase